VARLALYWSLGLSLATVLCIAVVDAPGGSTLASVIRNDAPSAPVGLGSSGGVLAQPDAAFGENSDGVAAWLAAPTPGAPAEVHARLLEDDPALPVAPPAGPASSASPAPPGLIAARPAAPAAPASLRTTPLPAALPVPAPPPRAAGAAAVFAADWPAVATALPPFPAPS